MPNHCLLFWCINEVNRENIWNFNEGYSALPNQQMNRHSYKIISLSAVYLFSKTDVKYCLKMFQSSNLELVCSNNFSQLSRFYITIIILLFYLMDASVKKDTQNIVTEDVVIKSNCIRSLRQF